MGTEFAQFIEWREYEQLEWQVTRYHEIIKRLKNFLKTLNKFYKENKAYGN